MLRIFSAVVLSFAGFVGGGAGFGYLAASPTMFESETYGTVPAHSCVNWNRGLCGMFIDDRWGTVEVPWKGWNGTEVLTGFDAYGMPVYEWQEAEPQRLTEAEITRVFANRAERLARERGRDVPEFAFMGFGVWLVLVGMIAAFAALRFVARGFCDWKSEAAERFASARRSAKAAKKVIADTVVLRAEVERAELLARKAVAEAKLSRTHPDAHVISVVKEPGARQS